MAHHKPENQSSSFTQYHAGRQTGSEGWRAARGELGTSIAAAGPLATAFKLADDESVQEQDPGRLCGGVVRASGEHQPHQTAVRVSCHANGVVRLGTCSAPSSVFCALCDVKGSHAVRVYAAVVTSAGVETLHSAARMMKFRCCTVTSC